MPNKFTFTYDQKMGLHSHPLSSTSTHSHPLPPTNIGYQQLPPINIHSYSFHLLPFTTTLFSFN